MNKIIVIEDDPGIQDAMRLMIEQFGYEAIILSNGDAIFRNSFTKPGLFVIDKQLSGVDGLEICRFLKENNETNHIPVVMLSASTDVARLAIMAGANDFLEKPFTMKAFRTIILKNIANVNK